MTPVARILHSAPMSSSPMSNAPQPGVPPRVAVRSILQIVLVIAVLLAGYWIIPLHPESAAVTAAVWAALRFADRQVAPLVELVSAARTIGSVSGAKA